jgi:competence ComEA-like helix-hairpin-helix protein
VTVGHSWHSRWGGCSTALAWTIAAATAAVVFAAATVQAADTDLDLQAVQAVCGRCHKTALFMNQPRSWERWNDVFADMTKRGANGTDEQLARVTAYFLENLTLVNVNSSPADELAWVLGVSDDVAQAIITRRERQPFANIAQLRAVPGVDPGKVEQRKSRILF